MTCSLCRPVLFPLGTSVPLPAAFVPSDLAHSVSLSSPKSSKLGPGQKLKQLSHRKVLTKTNNIGNAPGFHGPASQRHSLVYAWCCMWMRCCAKACLLGSTPGKANHKPRDLDLDQQWINKLTVSPAYQSLLVYWLTKFFSGLSFPHCDDGPPLVPLSVLLSVPLLVPPQSRQIALVVLKDINPVSFTESLERSRSPLLVPLLVLLN